MSISLDEVRHVAKLARLDLDETEVMSLQSELNALLGHFADIQSFDFQGQPAKMHAASMTNVWAEDEVRPSLHLARHLCWQAQLQVSLQEAN